MINMGQNFPDKLQGELVSVGTEWMIKFGESSIGKIRNNIEIKKEIKEFAQKYMDNIGENTRKKKKNIIKRTKRMIKKMGKEALLVKEKKERNRFYSKCRKMLDVSEEEISDELLAELFGNLQICLMAEMTEDDSIALMNANIKTIGEGSLDDNKKIKGEMDNFNEKLDGIAENTSNMLNTLIEIHKKAIDLGVRRTVLSNSENCNSVIKMENAAGFVIKKVYSEVTTNKFLNLLNSVEKDRKRKRYRKLIGRESLINDIRIWLDSIEKGNISFASLIGPGGAGKTHIGWEIAKEPICGFRPYYFEKESFLKLKEVMDRYYEDIVISENILFILDYVYERIDIIQELVNHLQNIRCDYKIAVIFIERDTTMEYLRNILPGSKKFFINAAEIDSSYWLNDESLKEIMRQLISRNEQTEKEKNQIEEFCRKRVIQLTEFIDKRSKRPIFLTFIADIYEEEILNNRDVEVDIDSLDSVMEKYWNWKTEIRLSGDYLSKRTQEEIIEIKNWCEAFSKILLVCASILGHDILIMRKLDGEFPLVIEIERALRNQKVYIIPFMEKFMKKIPIDFLKSQDFIGYMEKLCKTHMFVPKEFDYPVMIIRPEKDILVEWIIYKEYSMKYSESLWLRELISLLRNYASKGLIALVYRGSLDFPAIVDILKWIEKNDDFDRILIYCEDLLLALANKELKNEPVMSGVEAASREVINMLSEFEDYYNVDYNIKERLWNAIILKGKFKEKDLRKTMCFEIISELPEQKKGKTKK